MFGALGRRAGGLGLLPGGGGGALPLIGLGFTHPALSFARASAAALLRSTDGALVEVGSGVQRYDPTFGLLLEGQRTNSIRNPRAEGAVPGTPGTMPTNWSLGTSNLSASGITGSVEATGTSLGRPWVRIRLTTFGANTTSASSANILFDGTFPAAAQNQLWTVAALCRIEAGSTSGFSLFGPRVRTMEAGGSVQTASASPDFKGSVSGSWGRYVATVTAPVDGAQVTALASGLWQFNWNTGVPIEITFDIALPQLELASMESSLILPASGTPATTTRLADTLSTPLSSLSLPATGECTLYGTLMIPKATGTNTRQIIAQMDDGTTSNQWVLRCPGSASTMDLVRTLAGATVGSTAAAITLGAATKWALSYDATGRGAFCVGGGLVRAVTGGPTSGFTNLRFGSSPTGSNNLVGYLGETRVLPYAAADAVLQSLST